jgi:hypothetical protein
VIRIADGIQRDMGVYAAYDAEIATVYKNVGAGEREALGQGVSIGKRTPRQSRTIATPRTKNLKLVSRMRGETHNRSVA